ncbi:hypothetical protein ACFVI5_17620 [Streptomyces albogriseolus]|uniref:hypothetical protein n=1 Tax=Streptomyces albogriseolus TaxID=1887 RepID=UPI00364386AD
MSTSFLFSTLMGDDVGAYEVVVLAAEWTCAEPERGRSLGGRGCGVVVAVPWVEPTSTGTGGDEAKQRFEEEGDEAEHEVTP